jgi:hypothetical protein
MRFGALLAVLLWRANQPAPAGELAELVRHTGKLTQKAAPLICAG